ncbi:MAG: hypothetical protein H0V12_00900 [Chloroflexi bacterium]|nr:hypothetical protein [Chloroflexota bacterium]
MLRAERLIRSPTPAALGMLADIRDSHPTDRGVIMGLCSVVLGLGQIVGSAASGAEAGWVGIDGLLALDDSTDATNVRAQVLCE